MGRYRMLSRTNREVGCATLRASGPAVESLLRRLEAIGKEAFHRVGRSGDVDGEPVPRARRDTLEHVIGGILASRRPADADPDAIEVLAPERLRERPDPVVAGASPAELHHELLGR